MIQYLIEQSQAINNIIDRVTNQIPNRGTPPHRVHPRIMTPNDPHRAVCYVIDSGSIIVVITHRYMVPNSCRCEHEHLNTLLCMCIHTSSSWYQGRSPTYTPNITYFKFPPSVIDDSFTREFYTYFPSLESIAHPCN